MHTTTKRATGFGVIAAAFLLVLLGFTATAHAQGTCVQLSYTLTLGSSDATTGGDVSKLQQFLKGKGYFSAAVTGYYGPMTKLAVQTWQNRENFYEATGAGTIGPRSRSEILESCNAATINEQSVASKSNAFKLSGTAEGAKSIFVALVYPYTNEATDWTSVYRTGSYVAFTGDTVNAVKDGKWSVQFAGIRAGTYEARVYRNDDSSMTLLTTQLLEVTAPETMSYKAGSRKTLTLGAGQTATDGGVTITLNDVFLTNGLSGSSRASFVLHSKGFDPGSYSGGVGDYVPEGGGGIVDEKAKNGSMRIKIKSISQSMNTATFIVEAGTPKG